MKRGGLILYPTDTVWGIGCDATRGDAVRRIYGLKRRPDSKALITLVSSVEMLERHVPGVSVAALDVALNSPRPTTVVYPRATGVAPELLAPDGSAGIRVTREAYSSGLCEALCAPVVSTSANISGRPAPRFFNEIDPELIEAVDYVALYRRADRTPVSPSRVVLVTPEGNLKILRP